MAYSSIVGFIANGILVEGVSGLFLMGMKGDIDGFPGEIFEWIRLIPFADGLVENDSVFIFVGGVRMEGLCVVMCFFEFGVGEGIHVVCDYII